MAKNVVVLGAGMVGVSVAWHLLKRGYEVTVIDRVAPGQETSFGNAGIIQREAVRPYAFPRDLATLLRVLPNRSVDIRYRPTSVIRAAHPLLQYWHYSSESKYKKLVPEYAALIMQSLETHEEMITSAQAGSLIRKEGYLKLFRTQKALDEECTRAASDSVNYGVDYEMLNAAQIAAMEPSLTASLAGAIHWKQPWTVTDPGALVQAYADDVIAKGGEIKRANLQALKQEDGHWVIETDHARLRSDRVVMAMGPWSSYWLRQQGIEVPLFTKRGYHMHYQADANTPLNHWIMDAEVGYLLAPMRAGVRLTTGAELTALDAPVNERQLNAAEQVARSLYPLGDRVDAAPWKGGRPCLPDMKPMIGPAPDQKGLWLACGHGHQGFTLGPVTGKLLGQMIDEEHTDIDMHPYRVDRF
ncbi:amino acid dehydrogenase [Salinivibrio sp. ML323]|uniref:NAD(P)/FAD-dependent oxidoreductase n=1 Tax=unclassified Salinivibrio TaxID=2636825 RepID=UPI000985A5EE|nr:MULTISPECIES: FAD-dependent oxidoreductase [unclassified Salinivibrio]OOE58111.1 amino acid dehydrogenase [Salinivibrio sp. ML323]OOE65252.1 amino acid dehydrogenase [Salinivibrio sp. IB282]